MTRARDIMQPSLECIGSTDTAADPARRMSELHVGALPICGEDGRLKGMITDRDIVTKVVARGHDPASARAGELAQGQAVTIGADDDTGDLIAAVSFDGTTHSRTGRRRRDQSLRPVLKSVRRVTHHRG